jgi:hypothetical protein
MGGFKEREYASVGLSQFAPSIGSGPEAAHAEACHCPKTKERKFNLGMLNLYETHFIALFSVKYPYSV